MRAAGPDPRNGSGPELVVPGFGWADRCSSTEIQGLRSLVQAGPVVRIHCRACSLHIAGRVHSMQTFRVAAIAGRCFGQSVNLSFRLQLSQATSTESARPSVVPGQGGSGLRGTVEFRRSRWSRAVVAAARIVGSSQQRVAYRIRARGHRRRDVSMCSRDPQVEPASIVQTVIGPAVP